MNKFIRNFRYDLPLHLILLLTNWLPDNVFFLRIRGYLARPFFLSCGPNLRLGRNLTFYNPSKIVLGRDIYIAYGCWFMAGGTITIHDEVIFGPYCVIVSSNHSKYGNSFRFGKSIKGPIEIGHGSWVGGHVAITGNVKVGSGVLVGAGSVVVSDVEDNVLVVGQPARAKKSI